MDKKSTIALTAGISIGLGISAAIIGCAVKKHKEAPKPDFFVVDGSNIIGLTEYGKKNIKNYRIWWFGRAYGCGCFVRGADCANELNPRKHIGR